MKRWLLKRPSVEDLLDVLSAWRLWVAGAALGAALAAALYFIAPPPYRAQATVIVDHNVEMVLSEERSDRDLNYYLQRETDKLVLLAYADDTLRPLAALSGLPLDELRKHTLSLSQPGDGGWHFYADAADPALAQSMAAGWAESFRERAQAESQRASAPDVDNPSVISPYLTFESAQVESLPVERAVPPGVFLLAGSLLGAALAATLTLLLDRKGD